MIRTAVRDGVAVDFTWVRTEALKLNESYGYTASFTRHWVDNLFVRNDLSWRSPQNTRKDSVEDAEKLVLKWLLDVRQLVRTNCLALLPPRMNDFVSLFDNTVNILTFKEIWSVSTSSACQH